MPIIQQLGKGKKRQLTITIPQSTAKAYGWKKGTELVFNHEDGFVKLKEVKKRKS